MNKILNIIKESIEENIWPTRCVICDKPNDLICAECLRKISFIDINKACQKCGEPYGKIQCCGTELLPKKVISATILDEYTGKIITTYKDLGEIRLNILMANIMKNYINNDWGIKNISYIPSTTKAYKSRGYDHSKLLAEKLGQLCNIRTANIFNRPLSLDQRKLNKQERKENIEISLNNTNIEGPILIIDDVFTTGATINAATLILNSASINDVYALTFSRTF